MQIPKSVQTEIDASYLYGILANVEQDEVIKNVLKQMVAIERGHAEHFLKKNNIPLTPFPAPSWRAIVMERLAKIFGYDIILNSLMDTEKKLSSNLLATRRKQQMEGSISDTAHVRILQNILNTGNAVDAASISRFERRHKTLGGNALRAAVLGGNDGLVSNFSLIMGVAGATNGQNEVLLAGVAGLLAGALSMALGEWISVKSSQELYENQMELEKEELEINPEGEEQELALIYMTKGIAEEEAKRMANEVIKDKDKAHDVLIKEELGIQSEELKGSAMEAAIASFVLFAIGASIPLVPFFFFGGFKGIVISSAASAIGLFLIGAAITLFTGRSVWTSGFRQVIFGLLAAAITFGIGRLIGVSL